MLSTVRKHSVFHTDGALHGSHRPPRQVNMRPADRPLGPSPGQGQGDAHLVHFPILQRPGHRSPLLRAPGR